MKSPKSKVKSKIYVFGNSDVEGDGLAIEIAKSLEPRMKDVRFIYVNPNEDLPFEDGEDVVVMDVVEGLDEVRIIEGEEMEKLVMSPRGSVHDWDLGWQLKYLRKLGKLGRISILGVPRVKIVDYNALKDIIGGLLRYASSNRNRSES
jgi:Ni,Fe-hydrogenase maturation factor